MTLAASFASSVLIAGALLAFPVAAACQDGSRPSEAQIESYIKQNALVGFEWVDQPLNRILLVRGYHATCAVRFLSYRRSTDDRPPTSFDTGDATESATYEVAELNTNGAEVTLGPVVRKELDYRGMRGLGRLAFHVGHKYIHCGQDKYWWVFPTGLHLESSRGAAVAPTNWTSYGDIRLDHPKLRWYQRDERQQRPLIILPTEQLPGKQ